jgi:hypothetical protein
MRVNASPETVAPGHLIAMLIVSSFFILPVAVFFGCISMPGIRSVHWDIDWMKYQGEIHHRFFLFQAQNTQKRYKNENKHN